MSIPSFIAWLRQYAAEDGPVGNIAATCAPTSTDVLAALTHAGGGSR